jgi:hypothetical protein
MALHVPTPLGTDRGIISSGPEPSSTVGIDPANCEPGAISSWKLMGLTAEARRPAAEYP